jgi:hypothetical protein
MAVVLLLYEPQYKPQGWFDDQLTPIGWFDEELWVQPIGVAASVSEALLAEDHLDAEVVPGEEPPSVHWGGIGGPGELPKVLIDAVVAESAPALDVLDAVVVPQGIVLEVREIVRETLAAVDPGPLPAPQSAPGPAADVKEKDWRKYNEELLLLIE